LLCSTPPTSKALAGHLAELDDLRERLYDQAGSTA